ncbi:MAG: ribbon-helix-helix domain-containing protein [Candidatus Methanomethylophilaceae archaeon]
MSDKVGLSDLRKDEVLGMVEDDLEKITLRLPQRYIRQLDFLVKVDDFPSRSEAIRASVRDMLYNRVDMVIDKVEAMEKAEQTMNRMLEFEEKYLSR